MARKRMSDYVTPIVMAIARKYGATVRVAVLRPESYKRCRKCNRATYWAVKVVEPHRTASEFVCKECGYRLKVIASQRRKHGKKADD